MRCAATSTSAPRLTQSTPNTRRRLSARHWAHRTIRPSPRLEGTSPAASTLDRFVPRNGFLSFRARHDISLRDSRHRDHSRSTRHVGSGDDTSAHAYSDGDPEHHKATGADYDKATGADYGEASGSGRSCHRA